MVTPLYSPRTWRLRQQDNKFEAILYDVVRPCLRKQQQNKTGLGIMAQMVEHLPSKSDALSSHPSTVKDKME
jgi:hypothetical protein